RPRRARPVAGRLYLLPLEHRTHPLGGPRAEAPAAGRPRRPRRPGDHPRQRLGDRHARLRFCSHRRGGADVRPVTARPARRCRPRAVHAPRPARGRRPPPPRRPAFRTPLSDLAELGSPYLAGILDAADEEMLLLETTRGCVFKCKFCYYPKSYDKQYYLPRE